MPGPDIKRTEVIDAHVLRHCLAHPARCTPWTIRELAEHVGASPAALGHLSSGRRASLTTQLAQAIAEAVGVPPQVLFMPWVLPESDSTGKK